MSTQCGFDHDARGPRCSAEMGHSGQHLFTCDGPHCPGLPWPPVAMDHPRTCSVTSPPGDPDFGRELGDGSNLSEILRNIPSSTPPYFTAAEADRAKLVPENLDPMIFDPTFTGPGHEDGAGRMEWTREDLEAWKRIPGETINVPQDVESTLHNFEFHPVREPRPTRPSAGDLARKVRDHAAGMESSLLAAVPTAATGFAVLVALAESLVEAVAVLEDQLDAEWRSKPRTINEARLRAGLPPLVEIGTCTPEQIEELRALLEQVRHDPASYKIEPWPPR